MADNGIGDPVLRVEDRRLLTGTGRFADDLNRSGQLFAFFVRSPHAHADIAEIESAAARDAAGVAGVFTGGDLTADGVGRIETLIAERAGAMRNRNGSAFADPAWHPLPVNRVRHVGEPVAMVVADTADHARDAAEMVAVGYVQRACLVDGGAATIGGAVQLHDEVPGNLVFDWETGNIPETDAAFAAADHVTRLELVNNRLITNYLEPRASLAEWDGGTERFTLYAGLQSVHQLAQRLSEVFGLPADRFRVVSRDVGGGFGSKIFSYPEYIATLWAARRFGRPVKWTGTREEGFASDTQSRDHLIQAELALAADGRFLGLRVVSRANMGAYIATNAPFSTMHNMERMVASVYRTPAIHLTVQGVLTNKTPINVYRGVGRAEVVYTMERLIEQAAREIGHDRVALRSQNLVPTEEMPYTTPTGAVYDSGNYTRHLSEAMAMAEWDDVGARRDDAGRRGRLLGIGVAFYIEGAGGVPQEYAKVRVDPEDIVEVPVGSLSQGQGHETVFAQVLAEQLEIPFEQVCVVQGDTDRVAGGVGTFASRSMIKAGGAVVEAADMLVEKGRMLAADLLEASTEDIAYGAGRFTVAGTDRSVSLFDIARSAEFSAEARHENPHFTFPNGCHICEVEVDPETGTVEIVRFTVTDDVGRAVNPMIVQGQTHGAVVQGIGQAVFEHCVYDNATGQLLSGSLMDYALPRADDLPPLEPRHFDIPSPTNALGVKGAGEGGTVGAPPAVINAILDALAPLGVTHIDMPATPLRVWQAIRAARL